MKCPPVATGLILIVFLKVLLDSVLAFDWLHSPVTLKLALQPFSCDNAVHVGRIQRKIPSVHICPIAVAGGLYLFHVCHSELFSSLLLLLGTHLQKARSLQMR